MGDHSGHRARFRLKCARDKNPSDVDILELLLFSAIPRRDIRPAAEHLIEKYGSIDRILSLDSKELMTNPDIGASAAALIVSVGHLSAKIGPSHRPGVLMDSPGAAYRFMVPRLWGVNEEVFYVMCLNDFCRVVTCNPLGVPFTDAVEVFSSICEQAMRAQSKYVILFHCFPDFPSFDSPEVSVLFAVRDRLKMVDITLVDYISLSKDIYISSDQYGTFFGQQKPNIPYYASIRMLKRPNNPVPEKIPWN